MPRVLILIITCALLPSCGWFEDPPPYYPPPKENAAKLAGQVAMIGPDRTFVLIQRYTPTRFPQGTILTTTGDHQRTANLLVTGESHGNYDAADIQSGTAEVGDSVYLPPAVTPEEPSPEMP